MDRRTRGFTLFELLVGITVMGILMSLAVPSFQEYGRNSRIVAVQNDLVTAFNYARNEAIRRSSRVSVCATTSFTSCAGSANAFTTGWLAFTDETGASGAIDGSDEILQMWRAPNLQNVTLTTTGTNSRWVQFSSTGLTSPTAATKTYTFRTASCPAGELRRRRVTVSGIGAIRADRTAC